MAKVLTAEYENCTGCGLCVMICPFAHTNEFNPAKSRIRLVRVPAEGIIILNVCYQCASPAPCEEACPVEAIVRNEETGALTIDYELCTNCEACISACPYDNMLQDPETGDVMKCDFCDGDPECVKYCAYDVLRFVEADEAALARIEAIKEETSSLLTPLKQ